MDIVPRRHWGARRPTRIHPITTPTPELYLHHLAVEWHGPEGMRKMQDFHMDDKGWTDGGYSFVVDDDDQRVYEMRGAGVAGGHTDGRNSVSHAICVMGNFEARPPRPETLVTVAALIRHGQEQGWWGDLTGGHRNAPGAQTACPGNYLYEAIPTIRVLAASIPTIEETDDMEPDALVAKLPYPDGKGAWGLHHNGGITTLDQEGRPDYTPGRFLGSYPGLPEADRQGPERRFLVIEPHRGGYKITATNGTDVYRFPGKA